MSKNYASIYSAGNDSSALNDRIYIKKETVKGTLVAPTDTDHMLHTSASIEVTQPTEFSPHKSDRHHNEIITQKKEGSFTIGALFNIDTAEAQGVTEIDQAVRTLWENALGKEATLTGLKYTAEVDPSSTFSIFQCGDNWALQAMGCFVDSGTINLLGDGNANYELSGMLFDAYLVGIGKSVIDNNGGLTVTLQTGEGKLFPVGSLVMLVKADGTTKSADTATARKVVSVTGDVVTLDGANLADADGSGVGVPIYLTYWEPASPVAISDIQSGLQGSINTTTLGTFSCMRNITISFANNHELKNYCYGKDKATDYLPASKLEVTASIELNLSKTAAKFYNTQKEFVGENIVATLGDITTRYLQVTLPRVVFDVPSIVVPESGSIAITFEGKALESAKGLADEISVEFL